MNLDIKIISNASTDKCLDGLISQLGRLLAKEYVALMKKEEKAHEGGDLCQVFERESKTAEH